MAQILVVDDSLMMRRTIRRILEQSGHTVVAESGNGEQAILDYEQHQPDLVTLDITMPGLNGIETLKRIISSHPQAVIIMVSALGQNRMIFEAMQAGAKNYIMKPIGDEKLLSVIDLVLESSKCTDIAGGQRGIIF